MADFRKVLTASAALVLSASLLGACGGNTEKNTDKSSTSTSQTEERFDKAEAQKKVDDAIASTQAKIDETEKAFNDFYTTHTSEEQRENVKNAWEKTKEAANNTVEKAKNLDFSKENVVNNTVDGLNAIDREITKVKESFK